MVFLRAAKRLSITFGPRLKKLRELSGETQKQFANRCKVTVRTLSRWECGKAMPDIARVVQLAGKLNVEVEELLGIPAELDN